VRQIERGRGMEVAQVLHMNGGRGETSYAQNSLVQVINYIDYLNIYASIYVQEQENNK
jgi:hypothetical protein